jgi:predicted RNase H-like HicB family nuclease
MKDYHINVFFSEDDGCYVADIPDLKFCAACGASAEEAVREVQLAKAAWLKAARDRGKPIPKPQYRPVIYQLAR